MKVMYAKQIQELLMEVDTAKAACETACEDTNEGEKVWHESSM